MERRSARFAADKMKNLSIEDSETPKKSSLKAEAKTPKSSKTKIRNTPESNIQTIRGPMDKFLSPPEHEKKAKRMKKMADEELTPKQLLVKTEPYAPKPLKEKTPKNSRSLDNISKKIESSEEEDEENQSSEEERGGQSGEEWRPNKLKNSYIPKPQKEKTPTDHGSKNKIFSSKLKHKTKKVKKIKKSQEDEENESSEEESGGTHISEYERQIQLNIEERKRMFQMMVSEAKSDLVKCVTPPISAKQAEKASQRGLKRKREFHE